MAILVFPKKKEEDSRKTPPAAPPESLRQGEKRSIAVSVQTGALAGKTYFFDADFPLAMGRDPETCDLVLEGYPRVSRNHCTVIYDPGIDHFYITDTSMNGTYLLLKGRRSLKLYPIKKGKKSLLVTDSILFLGDENCIVHLSVQ